MYNLKNKLLPTSIALILSLFGITFLGDIFKWIYNPQSYSSVIIFSDIRKWLFALLVILIVWFWEKRKMESVGVRKLEIRTVLAAVMFGVISVISGVIVLGVFINFLGIEQPETLSGITQLPLIIKLLTITTAAITEELFYRGYAIERIGELSGSYLLAGLISGVIFLGIHYSSWKLAGAIPQFIFTVSLVVFYLKKRNLIASIIMHWVINFLMLIVLPTFI